MGNQEKISLPQKVKAKLSVRGVALFQVLVIYLPLLLTLYLMFWCDFPLWQVLLCGFGLFFVGIYLLSGLMLLLVAIFPKYLGNSNNAPRNRKGL